MIARLLGLVVLAGLAGAVIYVAVIGQRIDVSETRGIIDVERDTTVVDDVAVSVHEDSGGRSGVVLLHDDDVTGSLTLDDLSESLRDDYRVVRIDLPGFGLSDRMTTSGPRHTAARMAETVAKVISERFINPVIVVGVGFGGEVAAELAFVYPNLVRGFVMVDVDFDAPTSFEESLQSLQLVGRAAVYTWETGGRMALGNWAPFCDEGGWCPSEPEFAARADIVTIRGTTDSIVAFRTTPPAALAPSNLADITRPAAYVWSSEGEVSAENLATIQDALPDMPVFQSMTFQAHLEEPEVVATAVASIDS